LADYRIPNPSYVRDERQRRDDIEPEVERVEVVLLCQCIKRDFDHEKAQGKRGNDIESLVSAFREECNLYIVAK